MLGSMCQEASVRAHAERWAELLAAGRYCILLMSIFSIYTGLIYTGLIYNECFSIPMSVFGGGHFACPTNMAVRAQPPLCQPPLPQVP